MNIASPAENLDAECRAAAQLVELLKQEQTQLIEADINSLGTIANQKATLVEKMSSLAVERHKRLGAAGFAADEQGMVAWLKTAAAKGAAMEAWDKLRAAAKSAKEINRVNGLLINKHMVRTQDALNVLNIRRSGGGNLYGPNGQATNRLGSTGLVLG